MRDVIRATAVIVLFVLVVGVWVCMWVPPIF